MFKSGVCLIVGLLIVFMLVILIMTPDKTSSGEYTNVWKYWTDNAYFNQNFK
jgi:hypothetical protein